MLASNTNNRLSGDGPIVGVLSGADELVIRIAEQYRDQHCYLLGASGVGKSTHIFNSIVHDLSRGHGVCLVDPHGELFDRVLSSIPAQRVNDVIIVDPYDKEWSVGTIGSIRGVGC